MKVKVADIIIGDRFRKLYEGIDELALSIAKYGLLHPIVIDSGMNLCAGGRRMEAVKKLNWEEVDVTLLSDLTELQRREIELEENLCRKDMTWPEQVALTACIHELKQRLYGAKEHRQRSDLKENPGWGLSETADHLGVSRGSVMNDIRLHEAIKVMPELAQADNKNQAMKQLKKLEERAVREEIIRRESTKDTSSITIPFFNVNAVELLKKLPDQSVDCIITDPPWAVEFANDVFSDGFAEQMDVMDQVFREVTRICKLDAHIYVFFASKLQHQIRTMLERHLYVNPVPLVWVKNQGGLDDWDYKYVANYEPIYFCWLSSDKLRRLSKKSMSTLEFPVPVNRIHPTEKPTSLLRYLIEQSTLEGETVLDPFAGSASTLVAAKQVNRQFIGSELNTEMYQSALIRLKTDGMEVPSVESDNGDSDTLAEDI